MTKRFWIPAAAGGCALALVSAAGIATALHKNDVTLVVDGVSKTIAVREDTVAEVLELENLELGQHDVVLPGPDTEVSDDMEISVAYGRPLEVTVDGERRVVWTTARTVGQALQMLDLGATDSKLSTSRSTGITREGLTMEIATAKDVTITVAGTPQNIRIAGTVADVLAEAGVTPDADDKVTPAPATELEDGMAVSFVDVEVKESSKNVAIDFTKKSVKTDDLFEGTTKVKTTGVDGVAREIYTDVYEDGTLISSTLKETVVSTQPVQQVTLVGTKKRPVATTQSSSSSSSSSTSSSSSSGAGINLAREAMWDRIAQCESTGRWSINTGNGYYGGLQFNLQTWLSVDGDDFAYYPHQATRAEQITVANRLYEIRGTQPWSCA
ncbi:transglycosylase family protein [Tessaracoccus lapidicaptus]|uniref:transglycosylase family protein n=1 Tax=Tessaracoccus lapidicaptus TaxID=1427523 RepID=UPI003341D32B